jgi:hypothetical protein
VRGEDKEYIAWSHFISWEGCLIKSVEITCI